MRLPCPDKTSKDFKDLVKTLGDKDLASIAFFRNSAEIPESDLATRLLRGTVPEKSGVTQDHVKNITEEMNKTPIGSSLIKDAIFVQTPQEIEAIFPDTFSKSFINQLKHGAQGFYYKGKAYIILDHVSVKQGDTPEHALRSIVFHEIVGHKRMRYLYEKDPEFKSTVDSLIKDIKENGGFGEKIERLYRDYYKNDPNPDFSVFQEWFNSKLQRGDPEEYAKQDPLFKRAWEAIKEVVSKVLGLNVKDENVIDRAKELAKKLLTHSQLTEIDNEEATPLAKLPEIESVDEDKIREDIRNKHTEGRKPPPEHVLKKLGDAAIKSAKIEAQKKAFQPYLEEISKRISELKDIEKKPEPPKEEQKKPDFEKDPPPKEEVKQEQPKQKEEVSRRGFLKSLGKYMGALSAAHLLDKSSSESPPKETKNNLTEFDIHRRFTKAVKLADKDLTDGGKIWENLMSQIHPNEESSQSLKETKKFFDWIKDQSWYGGDLEKKVSLDTMENISQLIEKELTKAGSKEIPLTKKESEEEAEADKHYNAFEESIGRANSFKREGTQRIDPIEHYKKLYQYIVEGGDPGDVGFAQEYGTESAHPYLVQRLNPIIEWADGTYGPKSYGYAGRDELIKGLQDPDERKAIVKEYRKRARSMLRAKSFGENAQHNFRQWFTDFHSEEVPDDVWRHAGDVAPAFAKYNLEKTANIIARETGDNSLITEISKAPNMIFLSGNTTASGAGRILQALGAIKKWSPVSFLPMLTKHQGEFMKHVFKKWGKEGFNAMALHENLTSDKEWKKTADAMFEASPQLTELIKEADKAVEEGSQRAKIADQFELEKDSLNQLKELSKKSGSLIRDLKNKLSQLKEIYRIFDDAEGRTNEDSPPLASGDSEEQDPITDADRVSHYLKEISDHKERAEKAKEEIAKLESVVSDLVDQMYLNDDLAKNFENLSDEHKSEVNKIRRRLLSIKELSTDSKIKLLIERLTRLKAKAKPTKSQNITSLYWNSVRAKELDPASFTSEAKALGSSDKGAKMLLDFVNKTRDERSNVKKEKEVKSVKTIWDWLTSTSVADQMRPGELEDHLSELLRGKGFTKQEADKRAQNMSAQMRKLLREVQIKAMKKTFQKVGRFIGAFESKPTKQGTKAKGDLDHLIQLVRSGAINPDDAVANALSEEHGMRQFSKKEYDHLIDLEHQMTDPKVNRHRYVELAMEMLHQFSQALPPETNKALFIKSMRASMLSSLNVAFLHAAMGGYTLLGDVGKGIGGALADPNKGGRLDTIHMEVSNYLHGMKYYLSSLKNAWKNEGILFRPLETLKTFSSDDRTRVDSWRTLTDSQSTVGEKAKASIRWVQSTTDLVHKTLTSLTQGWYEVAEQMHFRNEIASHLMSEGDSGKSGMTKEQVESKFKRANEIAKQRSDNLQSKGRERNSAILDGLDESMKYLVKEVEDHLGNRLEADTIDNIQKTFIQEAKLVQGYHKGDHGYTGIGRIGQSLTDKISTYKVNNPFLGLILEHFVRVPWNILNSAVWASPYGFARLYVHNKGFKARMSDNKGGFKEVDPYALSLGTDAQVRLRTIEASAGTLMLGAMLALKRKDDETDGWGVTGSGPKNKVERDAWLKKGHHPWSFEYQHNGKLIAIPFGRGGFERYKIPAIAVAALDDMQLNHHGKDARRMNAISDYVQIAARAYLDQAQFLGSGEMPASNQPLLQTALEKVAYTGSSVVPWSGFIRSVERMIQDPPDASNAEAIIKSQLPVVNILTAHGGINVLGDKLKNNPDDSMKKLSDKLWYAGFPLYVQMNNETSPLYGFMIHKGAVPSMPNRTQLEEKNGPIGEVTWERYNHLRGSTIKKEMLSQLRNLNQMTEEEAQKEVQKISSQATREAKEKLHLK